MGGIQSAVTPNFMELYNEQSQHIAYVIDQGLRHGIQSLEASKEAEKDWVHTIKESAEANRAFSLDCTPGYYNNEGKPGEGPGWFGGNYAASSQQFFQLLKDWRKGDELRGFERMP